MKRRVGRVLGCLVTVAAVCGGVLVGQASAGLPEVGSPPPNFALVSLEGESHDLAERTGEGPTVLVFFRGAW